MTSVFGSSGYFASVVTGVGGRKNKSETQNGIFLRTHVLPLMVKLQKETRARKYKEVQAILKESVDALTEFEEEEWPIKKKTTTTTAATSTSTSPALEEQSVAGTEATAETSEGTAEEEAAHAQNSPADEETEQEHPAESSSTNDNPDVAAAVADSSYDDDPQTREPMHAAICTTLEALIAVLGHPAKLSKPIELSLECIHVLVQHRNYVSGRAGGRDDTSGSNALVVERALQQGTLPPPASLLHRLLEAVAKCCESSLESTQTLLIKTTTVIMTSPKCGVHESSMLLALRATFHVYLVTKAAAVREASKAALWDMLRSVIGRMEAYEAVSLQQKQHQPNTGTMNGETKEDKEVKTPKPTDNDNDGFDDFASQYHADTYVLFRSLCKMSSKELDAENNDIVASSFGTIFNIAAPQALDPMSLYGKVLSLELILAAINFGGEAFCHSPRFIYLVQHYLCNSLLKNCMSNHTQVAFLSQKIFLVLLYKFKGHMKQEIEVFMSNVFLRVLESPNSSFKQKALVLESLRSLCKDPVLLTQTFLNYDCDFEAQNLYKDIVHNLTKLGGKAWMTPAPTATKEAEQEAELSLAALEVLTTILKAFLQALGLPCGNSSNENEHDDDTAGARIRGMLQLDIGLAVRPDDNSKSTNQHGSTDSVAESDDASVVSSEAGLLKRQSPEDGATSIATAEKIVDAFAMKRNQEQNFEIGTVKFTLSLKSGLNFFVENGFVELDARSIALFFLANKDKLDKTQMGEALGREPDAPFTKAEKDRDAEVGGPGFWFRILHHYADGLDFTGVVFADAIRLFLSGFRLPGEAQKIDRIMEKFAERYTAQNPDTFASADTAFILAFSVIMLNTDLHNPSIKPEKRMTAESFIRNNSGIGENGSDLPKELLLDIFNRIKECPFSLKEDDAARERAGAQKQVFEASVFFEKSSLFGPNTEEQRRERFKKEKDEMLAVTKQLARRRPDKNSRASTADVASNLADSVAPADVVKPMFDVTWGPMLGILSQVLECSDDETSVAVCLNGFVYAVRIAAHSRMSLARDTFVSSLAKFTYLGSINEMKKKNLESIRTLLSIAVIDGEHLGESWGPVLQCISQIARLRLSASGLDSDESFLVENQKPKKAPSTPARVELFRQPPSRSEIIREAEENNAQAVLEAVQEVLIDKVFSSTVNLSASSLARFIEQLIAVSSSEIAGNSKSGITGIDASAHGATSNGASSRPRHEGNGPSFFSLQKLVEVADYNMDVRPRLVWAQVWEIMADYFAKIACDKNARLSVFAIDSLKQLSARFLEKPELSEFNFQRLFLKPFLVVMEDQGSSEDIREMTLQCVEHLIRTKSRNLRSGWKVVFSILRKTANDPSEKIDFLGLSMLQRLLDDHLHEICSLSDGEDLTESTEELSIVEKRTRNANVDDFVALCRASLSFVHQEESDSARPIGLSMRAFSHQTIYADLLADRRVLPPVSGAQCTDPSASGYTYSGLSDTEALEMALWRPLFEGLAVGVRSSAKSSAGGVGCLLQRSSVLAFRAILLRHGHMFSTPQWVAILEQTLIPAIQAGCENDASPVIQISSESPSISSIDFLVESPPLPPAPDDELLLAFKALHPTPNRSVGEAELMLEASFCDLRHGGDGDLRKAYALAKKDSTSAVKGEQPFPDSWVATTASIALGLLTDISSEIVLRRGEEGRLRLWPLIVGQYRSWCVGRIASSVDGKKNHWRPCEALVRISCREAHRFSMRFARAVPVMEPSEAISWSSTILTFFSDLISESVQREMRSHRDLIKNKAKVLNDRRGLDSLRDTLDDTLDDAEDDVVVTSYGKGMLLDRRKETFRDVKIVTSIIKLDFGATLYEPAVQPASPRASEKSIPSEVSVPGAYWEEFLPDLKIRCISAHMLQQSLGDIVHLILPYASHANVSALLECLTSSRLAADSAVRDEDVATAFQEELFSEWGDGVAEVEEALNSAARLSHLHGSGNFFLTQEASATNAVLRILSILYAGLPDSPVRGDWDTEGFAEPRLLEMMVDVHRKFLESEKKEGRLIDPHVWRQATDNKVKIALYCTCFAAVVLEILKVIRSATPEQFARNKQEFFFITCSLVKVQSEEIRELVSEVLLFQFAPMIGVETDAKKH